MEKGFDTRAARALRVHCPVEPRTLAAMLAGDATAMDGDRHLAPILAIVRGGDALGNFGLYTSVIEVAPGWELFTPGAAAGPTLGNTGTPETSPTAILTIYIPGDASEEAVDRAIAAILEAHPWEVPVVELASTTLAYRALR